MFMYSNIHQSRHLPIRAVFIMCFILALSAFDSTLSAEEEEGGGALSYRQAIEKLRPMVHVGLDPKLGRILDNYYENNFTSAHNWDKIQSVRYDGFIETPEAKLRFVVFKKKPNYYKLVVSVGENSRYVMAYDGEDAWQLSTDESGKEHAFDMPEAEALNFIRDATMGGHLFYPQLSGKEIRLDGSAMVEGERCYLLSTTLPNGDLVVSALDFSSFAERQQSAVNHVSGETEVSTHSRFQMVDGIRVPFASVMTVDGEIKHKVQMIQVQTNVGAMPWMFQRPSGAHVPDTPSSLVDKSLTEAERSSRSTFGHDGSAFEAEPKGPASSWDVPELAPLEIEKLLEGVK